MEFIFVVSAIAVFFGIALLIYASAFDSKVDSVLKAVISFIVALFCAIDAFAFGLWLLIFSAFFVWLGIFIINHPD